MSIVTNLKDFEELLLIAKRHGLVNFRIGEIVVEMPLAAPPVETPTYVSEKERSIDEIDAELYHATLSM